VQLILKQSESKTCFAMSEMIYIYIILVGARKYVRTLEIFIRILVNGGGLNRSFTVIKCRRGFRGELRFITIPTQKSSSRQASRTACGSVRRISSNRIFVFIYFFGFRSKTDISENSMSSSVI